MVGKTLEDNNTDTYVFFDIIKDAMKIMILVLGTYKSNILKIGNYEAFHSVIIKMMEHTC